MRLDKFICESTELTRSQAKRAIGKGFVQVEDQCITDPGYKVTTKSHVLLDGEPLNARGFRYIMIHKPDGMICSNVDEDHPSVLNVLLIEKPDILNIAGRLDVDTTGLVLVTDDGQWLHKVTSPRNKCPKRYRAALADPINEDAIALFKQGIQLRNETGLTQPAELEILSPHEVLLTITEGKYHQVKRMFAAIGNKVTELHRESIGDISLDEDLQPGEWRFLSEQEIASI